MGWELKRCVQCKKCPWKTSTNPHDIPDGYTVQLHKDLADTIADPDASLVTLSSELRIMSCHEHDSEEGVHCIGWLENQMGAGNNIGLRFSLLDCTNIGDARTIGPQHPTFWDTIPGKENA